MGQFHWDPEGYRDLMRDEVPDYERLQEEAVAATGSSVRSVLELGTGTGETARRVLERHPAATLIGVDASPEVLDHARAALPADRAELHVGRLEDPLPEGMFDVVISALAVHHLDGPGNADLFRRAAERLAPGGRVVIADVVLPEVGRTSSRRSTTTTTRRARSASSWRGWARRGWRRAWPGRTGTWRCWGACAGSSSRAARIVRRAAGAHGGYERSRGPTDGAWRRGAARPQGDGGRRLSGLRRQRSP